MKQYLFIQMPDGSIWRVPTYIIADHRNAYYDNKGKDPKETRIETEELFADDFELHDWASNNMNWAHVKKYAQQVLSPSNVDFEEGWANGKYTVSNSEVPLLDNFFDID
ncbi:hypothetical protein [Wielerella bovis]|uniref:hypothetical protein n=1 Tax=Wielerella bovis TaxID=2917790 RepID=UPI002019401D|nr:hypothetical protein [Wielerella bovis]ULJ60819.1 hypothetical protein MIS44_02855 [Wielerella bovis]